MGEKEELICQMTALRSLHLPPKWMQPFSQLQALTQLQHLSLGMQYGGHWQVAGLNAILRHCPLQSLVVGVLPPDFGEAVVDWAACPSLKVLKLWRESNHVGPYSRRRSMNYDELPEFFGLLSASSPLPALRLLSLEAANLTSQGVLARVGAAVAAAVAGSPGIRVEMGGFRVDGVRAADLLDAMSPLQGRLRVQELVLSHVDFAGPHEAVQLSRMFSPGCVSLILRGSLYGLHVAAAVRSLHSLQSLCLELDGSVAVAHVCSIVSAACIEAEMGHVRRARLNVIVVLSTFNEARDRQLLRAWKDAEASSGGFHCSRVYFV